MSFNNRNLNPNIWDCRNTQPFGNNTPNFYENNNIGNNFPPRLNFNSQHQIRPLLSVPVQPPSQEHHNFRNFNRNNQDFNRNSRPGPAGRNNNNFSNPPNPNHNKWANRKDDNTNNNNNGERLKSDNVAIESSTNEDQRPKSLVEQLKSTMKKTPRSTSSDTSESIDECARNASKKLFNQLKTMDKDNVKELINNPKQPHKMAVMNIQAREKLREGMRKQLKTLGAEDQDEIMFDVEESVNCENIPETLIAQIGRTVDIDLSVEDMDLQNEEDETAIVDKDMEVVEKNLGNDFLFGSEMLLMNGFSLLGENESEGHDGETDIKLPEDTSRFLPPAPPLPSEPICKPPEPVPSPQSSESTEAVLSSNNKPWIIASPKPPAAVVQRLNKSSELSSRNPDPPSSKEISINIETQPIQVIVSQPIVQQQPPKVPSVDTAINKANIIEVNTISSVVTENPLLAAVKNLPERMPQAISKNSVTPLLTGVQTNSIPIKTPLINAEETEGTPKQIAQIPVNQNQFDDENWDSAVPLDGKTQANFNNNNIASNQVNESEQKFEQRANETYGDYRRRLKAMEKAREDFNRPQQRKDFDEDDRMSKTSDNSNSWINNNSRKNNNNNNNERMSRFEASRGRNKNKNKMDRRNFDNNNSYNSGGGASRDRNNQWDRDRWRDDRGGRDENMKDAFNYRFDNSGDVDPERLSNILNPKPVNFRGSFNKRTGFNSRDHNRSQSREKTPLNNSVEREFGDLSNSIPDIRPCYHTMKKIMEIDNELMRTFDKIHGIDKVIANLQSERVNHQKSITRLMHDRKVLFDVVIRRSMANENANNSSSERNEPKEKKRQRVIDEEDEKSTPAPSTSCKPITNKKPLDLFEQKKRKSDESTSSSIPKEDDSNKKKKFVIEEEPKTAQQKQREQEEKERLRRIEEIRRIKQQRKEREAAAQRQLEEQAIKESKDFIPILKKEPRDKSIDKNNKSKNTQQQSKSEKDSKREKSLAKEDRVFIRLADVINPSDYKIKRLEVKLMSVNLNQTIVDQFKNKNYPEISVDDWNKWQSKPVIKAEKSNEIIEKEIVNEVEDIKPIVKKEDKTQSNGVKTIVEKDPLAIDDFEITNPPTTPGSHLTMDDEDVSIQSSSNDDDQDYSEWAGNFGAHASPIVHLQNIDGKFMVCATECGKLYKYRLNNGKCEAVFSMHTEICNSFLYNDRENSIYTASSDGTSFRIKLKTFQSTGSKNFNEALQIIEKSKYALYIGAKSGKIFKLKFDLTGDDEPLCCVDSFLLCMRASREGSRHILIVSSRNKPIQIRDANEGLLLRTFSENLVNVNIYDMLIEGSTIYCGSNLHEIFAIDFTNGALKSKRSMSGAGAICVKLYKDYLIAACYDGNIYIFNINSDEDAVNIAGPSKMILAMDLWDNKIIASTKDTTLKIMNIPT